MNRYALGKRLLPLLALAAFAAPVTARQSKPQKSSEATETDLATAKPGRDPNQPIDEQYTQGIRKYTTETFFTSPLVDYLPALKTVPTPQVVLGNVAGAEGKLPYSKEVLPVHAAARQGDAAGEGLYDRHDGRRARDDRRGGRVGRVDGDTRSEHNGPREARRPADHRVRRCAGGRDREARRARVPLRFDAQNTLLVSGLLDGGADIAQRPVVVDVPVGRGHVVLVAANPIYRGETRGSYFMVFNTILNFDSLDAGRTLDPR
jgi:hypothetical protein